LDVVGSGRWWENDGNEDFTEHVIANGAYSHANIYALDLDDDDDIDIIGFASAANIVAWWENDGDEDFTERQVETGFNGLQSVYACDLDSDDDIDLLGCAYFVHTVKWWENDGDQEFRANNIDTGFNYPHFVTAAALDQDDDLDVIAGRGLDGNNDGEIAWWENDNEEFTYHLIVDDFYRATSAHVVDVNLDGDLDVVGSAHYAEKISWLENDGEFDFTERVIVEDFGGAAMSAAADLDSDGDIDVLGVSIWDDELTWWESDLDPVPPDPPEAPVLTSPENESEDVFVNETVFTWEPADYADEYGLQVDDDPLFGDPELDLTNLETMTATTDLLEVATIYYWKVIASNEYGDSEWSDTWSFTKEYPPLPDAPTLVSPPDEQTDVPISPLTLVWNAADNAEGYTAQVSTDPLFEQVDIEQSDIREPHVELEGAEPGMRYYWRVNGYNMSGCGQWSDRRSFTTEGSDVEQSDSELPVTFGINSIHPNPFNPTTSIEVTVSEHVYVNLSVFDVQGREVVVMYRGELTTGLHRFVFDGSSLPSGVYVVRLDDRRRTSTKRMTLLK